MSKEETPKSKKEIDEEELKKEYSGPLKRYKK